MVSEITLQQAEDGVLVILPREMLERLQVGPGDRLLAVETEDGVLLRAYDPNFVRAMEAFERVRRKYSNALRELADS